MFSESLLQRNAAPSPRRSSRLKKVINTDVTSATTPQTLVETDKNKQVQSKTKSPKKKKAIDSLKTSKESCPIESNQTMIVGNRTDSLASNASSVETNIIENTEEHEVTRFKSDLRLNKNAVLSDKVQKESPRSPKLNNATENNLNATINNSNVIADSVQNKPSLCQELIENSQTDFSDPSPEDIFHPKKIPERQISPVCIF